MKTEKSSTEDPGQNEEEITTGGVTDHSDPSAAKTISSKEIERYEASFFTYDKYDLVKNNGTDKVTAGLSPEYGPESLNVTYASGEKLYFRYNGDMDEAWIQETKEYLEDLMINAGFEEMKPSAEAIAIEHFSVEFNADNLAYSYGELGVGEEKTVFCRRDGKKKSKRCRNIWMLISKLMEQK